MKDKYLSITPPERKFLSELLSIWPSDKKFTFLDIGANVGHYTNYIIDHISCDYTGHLFEPVERNYNTCTKLRSDNIIVNKLAIDKTEGQKIFFENKHSQLGSLSNRMGGNRIKVESTTIPKYIEKNSIDHIDLLKIDTEGSEFDIIHSCGSLFNENKISIIQFEYGMTWKHVEKDLHVTFDFLNEYNFIFFQYPYDGDGLVSIDKNNFPNAYNAVDLYAIRSSDFILMDQEFI